MPKHQRPDNLIRAAIAADEFGISRVTLWRWERDGILPRAHRINNQKYYPRTVLESLKASAARPGGVRAASTRTIPQSYNSVLRIG